MLDEFAGKDLHNLFPTKMDSGISCLEANKNRQKGHPKAKLKRINEVCKDKLQPTYG